MPLPFQPKPLDADAAAYIARSGATDRAAINAFVRGVKALGLWNNMVCWPLRSSQNAGFGSTAYSLGGLGTFNGTLVNAPGWTADGIDINAATTQSVDFTPTPLTDFTNGHSVLAVFNPTGPAPSSSVNTEYWAIRNPLVGSPLASYGQRGTGGTSNAFAFYRRTTQNTFSNLASATTHKDRFAFYCHNSASPSVTYKSSGGTLTPSGVGASTNSYSGNTMSLTAMVDGRNTSAFLLVTTPQFNLSASLQTALESLYKTTLGTGLGLP